MGVHRGEFVLVMVNGCTIKVKKIYESICINFNIVFFWKFCLEIIFTFGMVFTH